MSHKPKQRSHLHKCLGWMARTHTHFCSTLANSRQLVEELALQFLGMFLCSTNIETARKDLQTESGREDPFQLWT